MNIFPLRLGKGRCPLSSFLFSGGGPRHCNKRGEKKKGIKVGKGDVKMSPFVDDRIA